MRIPISLAAALSLGACTATTTDPDDNSGTDGVQAPAPEVVDTGWPPGDLAGFHVALGNGSTAPRLMGVVTESSAGFLNLAQCAVNTDSPCLTLFPNNEDDFEPLDTSREIDRDVTKTRFLGYEVELAGYKLQYEEDEDNGFGYYDYELRAGERIPEGWIGVKWGGQWPEFEGERMLEVSAPLNMVSPEPGSKVEFPNGSLFPIEWVPTGSGAITLVVESQSGLSRMYLLEDDGYFELNVDDLKIGGTSEEIQFTMIKWDQNNVRKFGHVIDFVATSSASFDALYFNIGPREELQPVDRCPEATGQDPLRTGGYWGSLNPALGANYGGYNVPGCLNQTGIGCAFGYEGFYKVEVPPKNLIQLQYNVLDDSASFWLVEDCFDPGSCVDGADEDSNPNVAEFVSYFNPTDDLERFYLVVDSSGENCPPTRSAPPVDTKFTLDVNIEVLTEPPMYDTCEEAEDAPLTFTGNYYAEFTAFVDDLNPGAGGCTSTSVPGADAMTRVEVPVGATLTASVTMAGADPALYFLYQCDDEFSCPVGSDLSLGDTEVAAYTNSSGATEEIYVVVDSKSGIRPYFLSLQF